MQQAGSLRNKRTSIFLRRKRKQPHKHKAQRRFLKEKYERFRASNLFFLHSDTKRFLKEKYERFRISNLFFLHSDARRFLKEKYERFRISNLFFLHSDARRFLKEKYERFRISNLFFFHSDTKRFLKEIQAAQILFEEKKANHPFCGSSGGGKQSDSVAAVGAVCVSWSAFVDFDGLRGFFGAFCSLRAVVPSCWAFPAAALRLSGSVKLVCRSSASTVSLCWTPRNRWWWCGMALWSHTARRSPTMSPSTECATPGGPAAAAWISAASCSFRTSSNNAPKWRLRMARMAHCWT